MSQSTEASRDTIALRDELRNFHRFADKKLQVNGYKSLEELLGLWRANHPVARKKPGAMPTSRGKHVDNNESTPPKSAIPYL